MEVEGSWIQGDHRNVWKIKRANRGKNERRYLQSATYCGEMVSSNSEPTGMPRSVRSHKS